MFERWRKSKEPPPPPEITFVPRVRKRRAPIEPYRAPQPEPVPEGRMQIDRAPGEPDRGSEQYRIAVLRAGIRKLNRYDETYDPGGW
jgi:hypothetical protein